MKTTIKQPSLINQNLKYLVTSIGGGKKFVEQFKKTKTSLPMLYSYISPSAGYITPNDRLVRAVSEFCNIPMDELYKSSLQKKGWKYIPSRLPVPEGNFIDGRDGYTFRCFQIIELLQRKYRISSLTSFVESLGAYRDKYTTFANAKQGIQKITCDIIEDLKKSYPEINCNFIFDGKLPALLESGNEKSTRQLKREIMMMVDERLKGDLDSL